MQSLIGMAKYLSKFLGDLSHICEPIRRLPHEDVPWLWTKQQDVAFDKIKEAVTSAPVLKYFDSYKRKWKWLFTRTWFRAHTGRPPCHLCKPGSDTSWTALLANWKRALGLSVWFRTQPSIRLWQKSYSLYRSQAPWCPSRESHKHLHQSVYRDYSTAYSSITQKSDTGPEERWNSPIPHQSLSPTDTRRSETDRKYSCCRLFSNLRAAAE